MREKQINEPGTDRGGDAASLPATERATNGQAQELHPDQELVYRLKSAIDQRGRYSFRLQDMTAGFAAGQNISSASARRIIEDRFTEQLGVTPREYLDNHYNDRREQGLEVRPPRQRSNDRDRGR